MPIRELIINPIGGLANRMRSIASGLSLASDMQIRARVAWPVNRDLNICYDKLFCRDSLPCPLVNTNGIVDLFCYDVPRKRNLYLPKAFGVMGDSYSCRLSDADGLPQFIGDVRGLREKVAQVNNVLRIRSGLEYYPFDVCAYRRIFTPVESVQRLAASLSDVPSSEMTGLHVRRTDNVESITRSPLRLFEEVVERQIAIDSSAIFYIASDSDEVKQSLVTRFGSKHFRYSTMKVSRTTAAGMQMALAEMLVLSQCKKIYGSYWSSYSEAAAMLGNVPFEQLVTK